jgi:poly-gamma-glutamate capsule biosynthesis protein CapA/YwtB (metallophosphatase superfamily)
VTGDVLTLFLCGDVMLGRGIDQVLPSPGDPTLQEEYVRDAREYVDLAERVNGPVPRPVDPSWPWGDVLSVLDDRRPDVRVVNLETSVTRSDDFARGKAVHYRMNPANLGALTVVRPDVCVLANNHVLDLGRRGLIETLDVLGRAGLRTAGAGRDADEARRPAVVPCAGRRVVVVAAGTASAGVPVAWGATVDRPGVWVVPVSRRGVASLLDEVNRFRQPGDVVVVSLHWGSNWGYEVPPEQVAVAHALVDGGVDVVHGHSSHHPRPAEVHRGRLILYGCGDLVNDYEGIPGYAAYRDDLRLVPLVTVEAGSGRLVELELVPMQARRLRLHHASEEDAAWLGRTLDREGRPFGSRVTTGSGVLYLRPP